MTHSYMSHDTCIHGTWSIPHPFSGNTTFPSPPLCVCLTDTHKQPVYRWMYVRVYMCCGALCCVKERPPVYRWMYVCVYMCCVKERPPTPFTQQRAPTHPTPPPSTTKIISDTEHIARRRHVDVRLCVPVCTCVVHENAYQLTPPGPY